MLALLLASPSTALRPNTTIDLCAVHKTTAKEFRDWSAGVWRLPRWERGNPPRRTVAAAHLKLTCAAGPGHAKAIRQIWRDDRRAYFRHRHAERERRSYTPYECNGALSAIPCYITACESGDSYVAENASGAYGRYQLMPEWWDHLGGYPSPAEQDRIAAELWAGGAGAGNWVCA